MKKVFTLLGLCAFGTTAFAQLPVSTSPENKNVVLEEFTGIYCGFCPDGHLRAKQLSDQNPGRVVLVNIHAGGYANPSGGDIDLRTSFGDAIDAQSNLSGYPAGTINRRVFAGSSMNAGGTAMGRGDWAPNAPTVLGEGSYVNVALQANIDVVTRVMTVDAEMYFTGAGASSVNLNVALLQNNIEGTQSGSSANPTQVLPNGNYLHTHALRHLLTGQWGDVITTTSMGTTVTKQYTWTIPADLNGVNLEMGQFELVAFVAEGQQNIITGDYGPIAYTGLSANNAAAETIVAPAEICGSTVDASFTLRNNGTSLTSATIEYGFAGQTPQTMNWTGNLNSFETDNIMLSGVAVPSGGGAFNIEVTSVNGTTDSNPADNSASTAISATTNTGAGTDFVFTMTQDRYGSEISWFIKDENGTVLASAPLGTYSDLSANGTQDNVHNLTLGTVGCFTVEVLDDYGDGINDGWGAGSYKLENSLGVQILSSNGMYGSEEILPFEITSIFASIDEIDGLNDLTVYPNPFNAVANIQFELTEAKNVQLNVVDMLGQKVSAENLGTLSSGVQTYEFDGTNLEAGIYFFNIVVDGATITKKVTLTK